MAANIVAVPGVTRDDKSALTRTNLERKVP